MNSNKYWLSEVRDWTDEALVAADKGMTWGHLPVVTGEAMARAGWIKRGTNGRWIITREGREKLEE